MLAVQDQNQPTKRIQLEEIMNNISSKGKKTRRGRKKKTKSGEDVENSREQDMTSFASEHDRLAQSINRTLLRPPASPKAPFNSTQFIMDDRTVAMDQYINLNSPEEFMINRSGFVEDFGSSDDSSRDSDSSATAYTDKTKPNQLPDDPEYEPMWINEEEFFDNDFEKQFSAQQQIELDINSNQTHDRFHLMTREDMIKKCQDCEKKLNRQSKRSRSYINKQRRLKFENARLKVDNHRLRQLIENIVGQSNVKPDL